MRAFKVNQKNKVVGKQLKNRLILKLSFIRPEEATDFVHSFLYVYQYKGYMVCLQDFMIDHTFSVWLGSEHTHQQ